MNAILHNDPYDKMLRSKTSENVNDVSNIKQENEVTETKNFGESLAASLKVDGKFVCKPMTVNKLCEQTLFVILNNSNRDENTEELLEYIRDVFEVSKEKLLEMLKSAQLQKSPQKTLCIEIDRAEDLFAKDSNGFSDPFVTVYIESNSTNRYTTAVVPSTLNPTWSEKFLIPLQRNAATEMLIVEVWDLDAAESVGEKMNKLVQVKGIRGFKKLLKEIALTASTGKHDNELIGRTDIPLKSIPANGIRSWYTLRKSSNSRSRGSILLHLYFSTGKNKVISINEHQNLLKIFLLHEFKFNNMTPYSWSGTFNAKADTILQQHSIQSSFSEIDCCLCQWDVFTKFHETHCLSLELFKTLLHKLIREITDTGELLNTNQFWEGYKRILPSCFVIVRSIRSEKFEETYGVHNLNAALEVIKKAEPPVALKEIDLFPSSIYGWLGKMEELNADIVLKETIKLSAQQFLNKMYENSMALSKNGLQNLIYVMRSIIYDLQTAVQFYDKPFYMKSNIKYAALLFNLYQENVKNTFFPKIMNLCSNLTQLNILDEEIIMISDVDDFKCGTLLFELYLGFKRFVNLGKAIYQGGDNVDIEKFYEYFYPAVPNWLNISVIRTLTGIKKAVEFDEFLPDNNVMKYTSSALDTLSLFYQMKYFWDQLDWPNVEESYLFVEKIVNDVCRCSAFYASRLSLRMCRVQNMECFEQNAKGSVQLCYAINDMNYVKEYVPLFVKELKVDDVLKKLAVLRSSMEAERCFATINNIICNAVDIVDSKISELFEKVSQMIKTIIIRVFEEGSELYFKNCDRMNLLIKLFQQSICVFRSELQEDSLHKLTDSVCNELPRVLNELIEKEMGKCRQPLFFENMYKILNVMVEILHLETNAMNSIGSLKEICAILKLYAMETESLIHHYYEDQLVNQKNNSYNKCGQLSIKAILANDSLQIHILNAYQLLPEDSERSCNSYVKVNFTPTERFIGIQSLKTSVQYNTRHPLYDSQFFIKITPEQHQYKNNILVFCVKNRDLFGLTNHYIAECYISFADIEKANNTQIRIDLKKPQYSDTCTDIIHILSLRTGDKKAKAFLKKLKGRYQNPNKAQ